MAFPRSTVLVVEDDPLLQRFFRAALMIAGYWVVSAGNGLDALRLVEGAEPSAVVLDLGLPVLSGYEVSRELAARSATANLPIVVVTAGEVSDLDRSRFACVIQKPVDAKTLIKAVESCLRKQQESTEHDL